MYYIFIAPGKIPDDFTPLSGAADLLPLRGTNSGKAFVLEDIFLFLANLDEDPTARQNIKQLAEACFLKRTMDIQKCVKEFKERAASLFGATCASFLGGILGNAAEDAKSAATEISNVIAEHLEYLNRSATIARNLAAPLTDPAGLAPSGLTNIGVVACTLDTVIASGVGLKSYYRPILGYCGNKFCSFDSYAINDSLSAVTICALYIARENVPIRRCRNCGRFFIPSSRSDESYCSNSLPNGKTCKTASYDEKIKKDLPLREYRKIYKTQNARKHRNQHRQGIDERFDRWKNYAKLQLRDCQDGRLTLQEMVDLISSDTWMTSEE